MPALGGEVLARAVPGLTTGQAVTLAIRPEKLAHPATGPKGRTCLPGVVKDLAYFGKDSLYRVALPSGALVSAHAVNARRGDEAERSPTGTTRSGCRFDPGLRHRAAE